MDTPTRHELDARLEAIEARMETRFSSIENSLSSLVEGQKEVVASNKSTRNTIIGTGVAVVLGIAAFNATVLSNMVASFESGKDTASLLSNTERSLTEATKVLEAATNKLTVLSAPAPAPAPAPAQK